MIFHPLLSAAGAAVILFTLLDVVWTTMHRGGGPITRSLVHPLWRLLLRIHHRGYATHRIMSVTGLTLVLLTVLSWIALTWAGWTLVFMGDQWAVVHSEDNAPAGFAERIYYTGFTVFTLGVGDYVANRDSFWQILTAVASFTGFGLITFALAYLIPVVQAAVKKRAVASQITAMGDGPIELVQNTFAEGSFDRLHSALEELLGSLAHLRQAHEAYPVLHFFHEPAREENLAVAVARLDEALRIAHCTSGTLQHCLVHEWGIQVGRFLATVNDGYLEHDPPPAPVIALDGVDCPSVDRTKLRSRLERDEERRAALAALVAGHGWTWAAVSGERDEDPKSEEKAEPAEESTTGAA